MKMVKMRRATFALSLVLIGAAIAACSDDDEEGAGTGAGGAAAAADSDEERDANSAGGVGNEEASNDVEECRTILELARADASLSSFLTAVDGAGLTEELKSEGLTILAPNDAAFEAFFGTTQAQSTEQQLRPLINYHVIPGFVDLRIISENAATSQQLGSLGGQISLSIEDDVLMLDAKEQSALLVTTDLEACNGIIHVIDKVLLPSIKDIIVSGEDYEAFKTGVDGSEKPGELLETLEFTEGVKLTLFSPPKEKVGALVDSDDSSELRELILYHLHGQELRSKDMESFDAEQITMLNSEADELSVTKGSSIILKDQSEIEHKVLAQDIRASNGVIHWIDGVLQRN